MLVRRSAILALGAALVCACGGSGAQPAPSGAALFVRDCQACHSLAGNESLHKQGGDLLGYRMTRDEWVQFTREMPVRHPLSARELQAVVDYVLAVQRSHTLSFSTHTPSG